MKRSTWNLRAAGSLASSASSVVTLLDALELPRPARQLLFNHRGIIDVLVKEPLRIDVPKEMAACVRAIGGRVLDDEQSASKSENADYWFPDFGIVAELKCLTDNLMTSPDFARTVRVRYAEWVRKGLVPRVTTDRVTLNLKDLPDACAREITNILKKKLEPSLKKGNRQIRATKKSLGAPEALGLLILVNEGNHAHTPEMLGHLLARIAKGQLSHVNAVSYLSANEAVSVPGFPPARRFWVDWNLEGREAISAKFFDTLRGAWLQHLSRVTGGRIIEMVSSGTPDGIEFQAQTATAQALAMRC